MYGGSVEEVIDRPYSLTGRLSSGGRSGVAHGLDVRCHRVPAVTVALGRSRGRIVPPGSKANRHQIHHVKPAGCSTRIGCWVPANRGTPRSLSHETPLAAC